MLNERSQSQKDRYYDATYTRYLDQSSSQRQKGEQLPGTGVGDEEVVFNGHRVSVWEDEKVLWMDGGDGYTIV